MKSVAELVRKPTRYRPSSKWKHEWPLPDTLMGIEVEVEREQGVILPDGSRISSWTTHSDGSLLNGVEYVLANPLSGAGLRGAIHELMGESKFIRTMTGSTHIHMDMLEDDTSPEVLRTMVMLVYTLEPLLYAAGDASREWCGYANRLMSGPDSILSKVMDETITADQFRHAYSRRTSTFGRYYGLNMAALIDYGSLEFRYFPTATSEGELIDWVELVQTFKLAAVRLGSREALTEMIEDEAAFSDFLNSTFGKWTNLFGSLGEYHELRNNHRKALITAQMPERRPAPFRALKVLSGPQFQSFLKFPPEEDSGLYKIVVPTGSEPIPDAASFPDGAFLVYGGYVYHTHRGNQYDYRVNSGRWNMLGDVAFSVLAADDRAVATIDHIANGGFELRYSRATVEEFLSSAASPTPEVGDDPDFNIEEDEE